MNNYYVYMYLRCKNSKHGEAGTPFYVGKGTRYRAYSTLHRVRPPKDKKNIVFAAMGLSEADAHAEEIRLIAKYGRIDNGTGLLRNLTDGGEGASGHRTSAKTKAKHSAALKGRPKPPRTEEHRKNARLAQLGKKQSPETIEKRAAARRGKQRPAFSEEWKRKISESKKGSLPNSGSFKNGLVPWNKGVTGYMGANETSFQPGIVPWNKGKKGIMGLHWTQRDEYRDRFKKG